MPNIHTRAHSHTYIYRQQHRHHHHHRHSHSHRHNDNNNQHEGTSAHTHTKGTFILLYIYPLLYKILIVYNKARSCTKYSGDILFGPHSALPTYGVDEDTFYQWQGGCGCTCSFSYKRLGPFSDSVLRHFRKHSTIVTPLSHAHLYPCASACVRKDFRVFACVVVMS